MTATTRAPVTARPAAPPSVSQVLHAGPTLEVALLAAALVEERHPRLRPALEDERHPWRRVLDAAALLRAASCDPVRAMALAARERALDGGRHVLAEGHDPDLAALRHALRVHTVLLTAAAAGEAPTRAAAERYVREQRCTAVLLGAEPDDLSATSDEVAADVAAVRAEVDLDAPARSLTGYDDESLPGSWAQACRLAVSVLPSWARRGPAPVGGADLRAQLRGL
ncbi:oxygenase MpaB family protein [Kineococcus sp. R86509]|uniref:oxygenase MpaB family protein n=1 Tax=Kineococcus sp. R86509 TaxID=3093851 RepID=UPI0036D2A8A4